ncbi:MFS transporter [Sphaerisporangium siamense]|uniref:MFS family permease n=1 Tax=Sphaerisporangium siamense TaxID=795645 RepID=A0A7W7GAV8_9ACTN|nr:MFS transporter [Sphaerisporangium siamense]MBB4700376.1 MFS family permease [Sphaerisporangium siamense]
MTMTLIATGVSMLSYALMQTMVVPALHVLQVQLRTTPTWSAWILSVFLLTSAASTPVLSKLGDRYSKRNVLLLVLAAYLIGTLGCAAAGNIGVLIACRAVQGVSLAALPLSFGILRDALPEHRLRSGLGLVSGTIGVGAGIGLVVGGLVVDHQSWRWLFAIAAVLILAAMVLVAKYVPDQRNGSSEPVDVPGAVLLALVLVALLLALTQGTSWGWTAKGTLALYGAAVVLTGLLVIVERKSVAPLIDPAVVAGRSLLSVHGAACLFGVASFLFYVLLPAYAQTSPDQGLPGGGTVGYGLGTDVTVAGLLLLPGSLALLPAGQLAGLMQRLTSVRATLASGFAAMAVGAISLCLWNGNGWQLAAGYLVTGIGSGLVLSGLPSAISGLTEVKRTATANGVNTVVRTAGGVVGSQLAAALLAVWHISGSGIPARNGFITAFWIAAAVAASGALLCLAGIKTRTSQERDQQA